eukprot:Filipodium_phascolosomae@DN2529_c0_g1_i5.p1
MGSSSKTMRVGTQFSSKASTRSRPNSPLEVILAKASSHDFFGKTTNLLDEKWNTSNGFFTCHCACLPCQKQLPTSSHDFFLAKLQTSLISKLNNSNGFPTRHPFSETITNSRLGYRKETRKCFVRAVQTC